MLRHLRIFLYTAVLLGALGGQSRGALLPDAFQNWGGARLLDLVQSKINGKVTAKEISGNPLTGFTYKDVVLTGPQGEEMFRADRLELRLSLRSIPALYPIVANLTLVRPHFYLAEKEGRWNFSRLAPPKESEAAPSQGVGGIAGFLFREVEFSSVRVEQGAIDLTRNGVSRRYSDLDLKAGLNLHDLGAPGQKIDLREADLGVTTPQGRAEFNASFSYTQGLARIERLGLTLAGRRVLSLDGEICDPLKDMSCKLAGQLGPLPGEKIRELWPRWPAPWDLNGKFSFNSTAKGMELTAAGGVGEARFDLQGRLSAGVAPPAFELDLDLKGLAAAQLQEIEGLDGKKMEGLSPVNAGLRLSGQGLPWDPERLKAELRLEPFQYREVKVKTCELTLSGDAGRQELQALAAGNFGSLTLEARGRLLPVGQGGPGATGDLTLKMAEFQPALLGVAKSQGTVLTGAFSGKFSLPPGYSPAQATLAGTLEARGRLAGEPLEGLRSRLALEARKLRLSEASLRLGSLTAGLRGDLTPRGPDLRFTATVAGSRGLPVASPVGFTQLQAEGAATGSWQEPRLSLTGRGSRLAFQGAGLETATFSADLNGWPPQRGQVRLQGSRLQTAAGAFAKVDLEARGDAGRWVFEMSAAGANHPRFRLAGAADFKERPLTVLVNRLTYEEQTLTVKNRAPFQLRFLPGWEISPAAFQVDGGLITVQGRARGAEVSGNLTVQDLNADLLSPLGLPVQGKINGKMVLAGAPGAPVISGNLSLAAGKIQTIPIQTLTASLSYEDGRLQVDGNLQEGLQQSRLAWKGTVPVQLSLLPPKFNLGDRDFYLRLHSDKANLCMLVCLSKEVPDAQSSLDLLVEARGDPRRPQISGYIRWGEGRIQLQATGTSYLLAAGEIRLLGDKVVIPGITLTSEGTLRLSGDLELGGATAARLRAQLDNFLLLNRGGNQIWTNGQVDLSGPFKALLATGHLTLPKAQFRPTFFRSSHDPDIVLVRHRPKAEAPAQAPALYRNMRVDVPIESPGNVWLKDPVGQVEMTGKVRALKKPGQKLVFGGEIRALKGTVDVQEREFKVERAAMILPGVPREPITVTGKAIHRLDEITLVMTVNGTVTNPQIRLESEPPLPPSDVLAYLVFGAPTAGLSKEQYYALGAQTLGVLGGITSKKIGELLGSSVPFLGAGVAVKSGTVAGKAILGVEKKLTQDVTVSYQRNFNEERGQYERQVVIDYKFNKSFSVESQLGTRNSGADVFFNYDF